MNYQYLYSILFILFSLPFFGQENENAAVIDSLENEELIIHFRPQVSIGTGMFTFMGDVANNHGKGHLTVSRLARDLRISQALNPNFDLSFYVLFGQVSSNERSLQRNLNFNSHITTGGAVVSYNFYHLLKPKRNINPYISLGVESIEFLSKSDLMDANGNVYHYWSDGSIMNMDENDPNSTNAIELFRDYTYESDLREANLDGFGKYQERTLAIPIDIGANFHLSDRLKARLGTSMHFTFSDLIDNVSDQSEGLRKGDRQNDKLLYTHFALSYDFGPRKKRKQLETDELELTGEELLAADTSDYDQDGVYDLVDDCIKTPKHAFPVDEKGCPLDDDQDFVPNYRDDEKNSLFGSLVDAQGVTQYDDDLEKLFLAYIDSNGSYYTEERHVTTSGEDDAPRGEEAQRMKNNLKYTIVIGTDSKEISANELHKYLSYKDFKTIERGDSIFYVIGGFETIAQAMGEKNKLEDEGVKTEAIALLKGQPIAEIQKIISKKELKDLAVQPEYSEREQKTLYRVQIGAFNRKISQQAFAQLEDVEEIKGNDGLYRYYSGSFTDKEAAAKHRIKILSQGYSGAFLVVYDKGKRISLTDAGFDVRDDYEDIITESSEPTKDALVKGLIKFRVQVGAYENDIPTEVLDVYLQLGSVLPKRDSKTGITKYLVGKFDSYKEAEKYKIEIQKKGIVDAFIIGDFNGKMITAQEALELTK
ncbi:MAG: SPOR domain-containing protein [Flavobacteriales bacterium]|jgi:cell division protein FtsN|nr:SPOR domain-containing protein [Flavobacteriales bacterium]